ncbi:MAG: ABC transporter substrate-binding protein [Candidatus Lambdaproteobacteria bacterium]|nr:ABC transporter substrate-binding protein [Candidatus Lambdaproteobacteria bacterium]
MSNARYAAWVAAFCALITLGAAQAPAQKYGGTVKVMFRTDPPSLNIHEGSANDYSLPMMPAHSNLVLYKPEEQVERLDTIMPELAESWSWSPDHTRLTFKLRQGVTFHDGKPFSSADVKATYDMARGADAKRRLRLNPRKSWFKNITEITTRGDQEVTFTLGRPQPALLAMLASGQSPVLAAHLSPAELRSRENGTGPFRLKQHNRDKNVLLEKNPHYFVKGRPYLDAIDYIIIRSRGTRIAAMQANQLDIGYPTETDQQAYETLKKAVPKMKFHRSTTNSHMEVVMNLQKPPFNNRRLREAVNLALDREEFVKVLFGGAGVVGSVHLPPPFGTFGLPQEDLVKLPGYNPADLPRNRERARQMLVELGYSAEKPLSLVMHVRATNVYIHMATWATDQLSRIGIKVEIRQVETANWFPMLTRRDFQMLLNTPAIAIDDPDANLYENFSCGSERNYGDYCEKDMEAKFAEQSSEIDQAKRVRLVHAIDRRIEGDFARPNLGWRIDYYAYWPHVKDFYPHNTIYNYFRMQDVWLDK